MRRPITDWDKFRDKFVRETLRRASFRWPPRNAALKAARFAQILNPRTERTAWTYKCAICFKTLFAQETKIDHIEPVVSVSAMREEPISSREGSLSLGSFVLRMFPTEEGFQVLCRPCHDTKTRSENEARRANRKAAHDL